MGKPAGSINYSLPEVMHMLSIAKKVLPQGKDMWDSVVARSNATNDAHWPERDMESLRRKFKSMYGLRKPTGTADVPAHVRLAKEVKKLIDEASSVFLTSDDEAEEESQSPRGQCQTPRPAPGPPGTPPPPTPTPEASPTTEPSSSTEGTRAFDESSEVSQGCTSADYADGYASTGTLSPFSLSSDDTLGEDDVSGLEDEAKSDPKAASNATPKAATKATLKTAPKAETKAAQTRTPTCTTKTKKSKQAHAPASSSAQASASSNAKVPTSADARERLRYPKLSDSSGRHGGVNLADMRDARKKRPYAEFEEASYTKQKCLKAEKAAAELERKLDSVAQNATESGGDIVKTIMVLRADAGRVEAARAEAAETRRREERRVEREATEERRREERRADREAMEERHREDRREARQHMQDMPMMLATLQNGTIPPPPVSVFEGA